MIGLSVLGLSCSFVVSHATARCIFVLANGRIAGADSCGCRNACVVWWCTAVGVRAVNSWYQVVVTWLADALWSSNLSLGTVMHISAGSSG